MKKFLLLAFFAGTIHAATLPDPVATPGATNPAVTQATLKQTVCHPGYSASIRPPASYTNKLKYAQLKSGPYQSTLRPAQFEEDHLISLVLGGAPRDPKNLWPQPRTTTKGAAQKDVLEVKLSKLVCAGKVPLAEAQQAIAKDWIAAYAKYSVMK